MKPFQLLLVVLSFSAITACVYSGIRKQKEQDKYAIRGQIISQLDIWEPKVYLMACQSTKAIFSGSETFVIDSADIDEEGRFYFSNQNIKDSLLYRLNFIPRGSHIQCGGYLEILTGRDNYIFLSLTPNSHISLKIKGEDIPSAKIQGDKDAALAESLMSLLQPLRSYAKETYGQMQKIMKQGEPDSLAQAKLNKLKKEFIEQATAYQDPLSHYIDTVSSPAFAVLALHFHGYPALMGDYWEYYQKTASRLLKQTPNHPYLLEMDAKLKEFAKTLPIGSIAPEVSLPDTSGQIQHLHDTKASLILIDFWASWCTPCRIEIRETLKPLYEKYHSKGFEIFAISTDEDKTRWIKAIKSDDTPWIHVACLNMQEKCEAKKAYQVKGIPHTILIDSEKKIVAKQLRGQTLQNFVEEWFEEEH